MDNEKPAIVVNHVNKTFKIPLDNSTGLKNHFINIFRRTRGFRELKALKDVSFEIKKGEFFGIVGRNGSGKSTLLKLLAGIYSPNSGIIQINGKLTPFIELGVGFNPELTGRENVFLNGSLLGFTRKEINAMYQDIVDFAELHDFMFEKLKNYSSGMQVRLAFSIAVRANTDILVLDEVLAVGDAAFQQKCFEYFRRLKEEKRTVVFVSHDRSAIENFCSRCILIDNGQVVAEGEPTKVLNKYNEITLNQISLTNDQAEGLEPRGSKRDISKKRWGTKEIEITRASLVGDKNKFAPNEPIEIKINMKVNKKIYHPVYGITIKRSDGKQFLATNTKVEKIDTGVTKIGERISVTYRVANIFGNGSYAVSPAVANQDTNIFYDWREELLQFYVAGWDDTHGDLHPPHSIEIERTNAKS